MSKYHLIFDYETFGTNTQTCPVIDCAYVIFDWERFTSTNPYTFEELVSLMRYDKLNVVDQIKNRGYIVEQSTLEFWKTVDVKAREKIKPSDSDILIEEYLDNFENYITSVSKIEYWWTRSNTFDPIILTRLSGKRFEKVLPFWTVRDTRTFIDAKLNFPKTNGFCPYTDEKLWNSIFEKHNAIHDVAADILRLQKLTRLENELESI